MVDVTGTIAAGCAARPGVVAVVNPTLFFAESREQALVAADRGNAACREERRALETLAPLPRQRSRESESPPLRDIAATMMKVSQNLYAETLLKAVGAARGGPGTSEHGRSAARGILTRPGTSRGVLRPGRRIGPVALPLRHTGHDRDALERMYGDQRHRDRSSPRCRSPARTARSRRGCGRTRAEGNAVAKTGSIANVRALSGYVRTRDGELLVVLISRTISWFLPQR